MKRYNSLVAAGLMLAALAQSKAHAADNTWNNGSTDFLWNGTSLNWASPTTWVDGDNAIFNATGAGPVSLGAAITAQNLTFNAGGYVINGGGNVLTLAGTTPTITANASNAIATSIAGNVGLTLQGTSVSTLLGDATSTTANTYTGGTFVKSGKLILRAAGVNTSGAAYAVDNIEAIDAGATVEIGTLNDGSDPTGGCAGCNAVNIRPADGQILRGGSVGRLNLTGGTFDNNGDNNGINYPPPEGTGTIINTSPYQRAVLKLSRSDAGTFVFDGQIKDGGQTITKTNGGPGYQQNVDMNGGNFKMVWGGSNSFTGFLRLSSGGENNKVTLTNNGTLGYPAPINCPARQILMNSGTIDLNGTSQKVGYAYTGNNTDSIITNSAIGTVSTLTVCYNCTNLVAYNGAATPRGIRCGLLDDPTAGGTLALVKEGVAIQPIGVYAADVGSAQPNNYHGDTTVNKGILEVLSVGGISPNSTYRLNTPGVLQLDYVGDALVRGLYINGVEMAAGTYSSSTAPITGTGTITVPPPNTWNNASGDFLWNGTSLNWTSPTTWLDGANAVFGATGAGSVANSTPVSAHNITFTAPGYVLQGNGNALTLVDYGATITANAGTSNHLAVSILGTSGVTFKGTGTTVLAGDASVPDANRYTGGTYIRSGTVILRAAGAVDGSVAGGSHAVDSIEALDTGATLKFGTTFNGVSWDSAPSHEQIGANIPGTKLVMTGGTLDLNNDPKNQRERCPDGFGLIINNGSSVQAGLNVIMDGLNHTFSGVIADGNGGVLHGDNFSGGATPQGPGYQIGIISISGTAGSTWTLAGDNTYSGSTRIDGNTVVKLGGNHSLGTPTLTGSLTGPMRIQGGSALDMNGRNQTIALMTDGGGTSAKIYNSALGTVSTLTVGYGNEQAGRNIATALMDNTGVGGLFAFRKINTQPFALIQTNVDGSIAASNWVTTCTQGLKSACVATYSGDTSVEGGTLDVQGPSAISPNSAYRINTTGAFGAGVLKLSYAGDAPVRQLWLNGLQQPSGTDGAGTPGIDPSSSGTITVTGFAPAALGVTQSGGNLNFTWSGVYQFQSSTNNVLGPYSAYSGGSLNAATVPINPAVGAVYFRLVTF